MGKLSFLTRLGLCMALSLVLNALVGEYLKSSLSKGNFTVNVDANYGADATMELMYDTGRDFNQRQRVSRPLTKGQNKVRFPFELQQGEHLRYIRLDFGTNTDLKRVEINAISLFSEGKQLFRLKKEGISKKIGLLTGISIIESTGVLAPDIDEKPFDPYIVFDAVNELIFPKWLRILMLVLPWFVLLFIPLLKWLKRVWGTDQYILIFIGLFCAAIPLKIAWVTFTTILLTGYALLNFYRKRTIRFEPVYGAMLLFFLVPALFLGKGEISQLAIPVGFVLFAIIGSLIDFSPRIDQIKKIYGTVFLVVASITVVSWVLLMGYYGYYYKIDFPQYFMDIKTHAHATMFWLYYPHTTFLSFFLVIGGLLCFDLFEKGKLARAYVVFYGILGFCSLILLGSRFALLMGLLLPFLTRVSAKKLGRWLVPAWAIVFGFVAYFIAHLDFRRNQLWKIAWDAFEEKPWLGHGTGTSEAVLNNWERVRRAGFETPLDMNHPHNQFLTYLLENGLLGTVLVLGALFYIVYQFARQQNKSMLLVCLLLLMLMIIESPFRTTTSLYVIGFLFSIFASCNKTVKKLNK